MQSQPVIRVDARGLRCPLPVLRLRKAAQGLAGGLVELTADDPAADADVPAFVHEMGWTIEANRRDGSIRRWSIRIGPARTAVRS